MTAPMTDKAEAARITNYLASGGLWNPESMEHDKVLDLLIDCREALTATQEQLERCRAGNAKLHRRAQQAERIEQSLVDQLTKWTTVLKGDAQFTSAHLLFRLALDDVQKVATRVRSLAKPNKGGGDAG
jgi:hypothetical protein